MIDFPLFSTFRDNVTKGSFGGIGGVLAKDYAYADPTQLVTFFQNHDVDRTPTSQAVMVVKWPMPPWRITCCGQCAVFRPHQGEEIAFQAGLRQDIKDDPDSLYMTGRAYYGDKLDDKATVQANPLYQHIKRLNQIRKALPALQKGVMSNVNECNGELRPRKR